MSELWFDVEIEGITTPGPRRISLPTLWFDVEIEGITTLVMLPNLVIGCGLT